MKIKLFRSKKDGLFYFRIVAGNGRIVAQSEGYKRVRSALKTLTAIFDDYGSGKLWGQICTLKVLRANGHKIV